MRTIARYLSVGVLLLPPVAAFSPHAVMACERCFGAGVDSPIVSAIGMSMMSLLVLVSFVISGIVRFFNQSNTRALELAAASGLADRASASGLGGGVRSGGIEAPAASTGSGEPAASTGIEAPTTQAEFTPNTEISHRQS